MALEPESGKIYATYQVVDLITRRMELLRRIHASPTPVLEGVLEAVLEMVNTDLVAIQPEDVNYNIPPPGTA